MPGRLLSPSSTEREVMCFLHSVRSSGRHRHSSSLKHEVVSIVCVGMTELLGMPRGRGRSGLDINVAECLSWAKAQVHSPWISNSCTTWEPVINAEFQAPPQICWFRLCTSTRCSENLYACCILRNTTPHPTPPPMGHTTASTTFFFFSFFFLFVFVVLSLCFVLLWFFF